MTGRQRRLAERQMQRQTIMHGMEEENIDRQRNQQKELWGLEDERFRLAKEHFTQQEEFQKEGIKKQEEFYERRRKLEEEMVEMQRTYMLEQLKLQESAIGAQAQYAKEMHEHQLDMISMNQEIATTVDTWKTAWSYGDLAAEVFAEITKWLEDLAARFDIDIPKGGSPPPGGKPANPVVVYEDNEKRVWSDGRVEYKNGGGSDTGTGGTGTYTPTSGVVTSTWEDEYLSVQAGTGAAPGMQEITIYIGNEVLGTYVIDTVTKELTIG